MANPKPKARGRPAKAAKPKAKTEAPEKPQRERFIEAARAVGVDETGAEFERAIGLVVRAGSRPKER